MRFRLALFVSCIYYCLATVKAVNPDELNDIDYEIWDIMDAVQKFNDGKMISFYEFLGIEEDLPMDAIGKVFRRLSLSWHPDKNPSPDAEQKFQILNGIGKILRKEASREK